MLLHHAAKNHCFFLSRFNLVPSAREQIVLMALMSQHDITVN